MEASLKGPKHGDIKHLTININSDPTNLYSYVVFIGPIHDPKV